MVFERILLQLQLLENKKFTRAKNNLEVIKTSTRATINAMDETIYVDNVPTGLKAATCLYDIQQQAKMINSCIHNDFIRSRPYRRNCF